MSKASEPTTVPGLCRDCCFREQERQDYKVVDNFCGIFDVFVPMDGFCHAFSPANA